MSENILIAILSLLGTLGGSFAGIITSGKLTNFRLSALEEKVEKLTGLIDRTYALETKDTVSEEKMKHLDRRVQTLEQHLN
jgi:hypothetical protein